MWTTERIERVRKEEHDKVVAAKARKRKTRARKRARERAKAERAASRLAKAQAKAQRSAQREQCRAAKFAQHHARLEGKKPKLSKRTEMFIAQFEAGKQTGYLEAYADAQRGVPNRYGPAPRFPEASSITL